MLSGNSFKLDWSQMLLFGKELRIKEIVEKGEFLLPAFSFPIFKSVLFLHHQNLELHDNRLNLLPTVSFVTFNILK